MWLFMIISLHIFCREVQFLTSVELVLSSVVETVMLHELLPCQLWFTVYAAWLGTMFPLIRYTWIIIMYVCAVAVQAVLCTRQ